MLRWFLSSLLLICHCNADISFPVDGRQFTIKGPNEVLALPNGVLSAVGKFLMSRSIDCAVFTLERTTFVNTGEVLEFQGSFTVNNSLTMDYQPQNLTADMNYATNLTETLKRGINLNREISEYLNVTLQSGTARLKFVNSTNESKLFGALFLPTYSRFFLNTTTVKLSNSSLWSSLDRNMTSDVIEIQDFSAIAIKDRLQISIASKSKITLNNAYFYASDTPEFSNFKPEQIFKFETCDSLTRQSQNSLYSNLGFAMLCVIGLVVLNSWAPKTRRRPVANWNGIEMRVFDEATLKLKAEDFFVKYPIGSVESRELDKATALLPQTMVDHPIAISMIPPRDITDFDCFGDVLPVVEIGEIDDELGSQMVKFTGGVECNVQCNSALVPRVLDTELPNDTVENDQLPPPAFNSIDSSNEHLECFYQVRIVTLEENNPNLAIGFVTGLYPPFRLPGLCDKSIAFHCHDSTVRFGGESIPFPEIEIYEGDILGIGYYLQPPTEIKTKPDSTLKNVHFYFTFEKKRYEREFVLENMDIGMIQPSIGSRSDCEVEVVFGPLYTAFAPESV